MKTMLLAAAALSLVACSAENASNSESAEAADTADTAGSEALTSVPVTINVPTDFSEMRCRILMGSFISFRFQFHDFLAYAADDIGTCGEKLDALQANPVHHAIMVRVRHGDVTTFTLQMDGFLFTSRNPTDSTNDLVVTQTSDVEARFTNPRCRLSKGFSTLLADFNGVTFEQQLPFNACTAAKTDLLSESHSGKQTVSTYEAHTWRELDLDDGKWHFTADVKAHE